MTEQEEIDNLLEYLIKSEIEQDIREVLSDRKKVKLLTSVASNENTESSILFKLFEISSAYDTSDGCKIRSKLVSNSSIPINLLKMLSRDKNSFIRTLVAMNKRTPIDVLDYLSDDDCEARFQVAQNPNTPAYLLTKLSDPLNKCKPFGMEPYFAKDVRRAVARNKNTPKEVLKALREEEDINVVKKEKNHRISSKGFFGWIFNLHT